MFMIIEIIEESLGWRTFIHRGYQIIWSKGQNNENINKNQHTKTKNHIGYFSNKIQLVSLLKSNERLKHWSMIKEIKFGN
jgi:hypothetical protein